MIIRLNNGSSSLHWPHWLNWQRYDPTAHDRVPCIYLLLHAGFGFAPIYVGQAGAFLGRLQAHARYFIEGKHTMLLDAFSDFLRRSHWRFASRWREVGQSGPHVYVPQTGQSFNILQSFDFLASLEPLVSPVPGRDRHEREVLETRVRMDLEAYYTSLVGSPLSWGVPPALAPGVSVRQRSDTAHVTGTSDKCPLLLRRRSLLGA